MSVHPKYGYLLKTILESPSLKDYQKEEILSWKEKVDAKLLAYGFGTLPSESLSESISNLTLGSLKELRTELRPLMIEWSLVHPKVELSTEYIQLKELVETLANQKLSQVLSIIEKLDKDLKTKFSQALDDISRQAVNLSYKMNKEDKEKHKEKLEMYFGYSDFKPLIKQVTGDDIQVKEILSYQENYDNVLEEIFGAMRQQVLAAKANLPGLVKELGTDIINVQDIKEQDPIAYEYLKTEAFSQFCEEKLGLSISINKTFYQDAVHPQHNLAQFFQIKPQEMALVSISADPIPRLNLNEGQVIGSKLNQSLQYKIKTPQEIVKEQIVVSYKANEDLVIKVIVPIFVSFVRTELVYNQKNNSIIIK